jgi:acetyl esterase
MGPDPQFAPILERFASMPSLADVPIEMVRKAPIPPNPNPTPVDSVEDRMIPGPGGELKVRIYRKGAAGALPLIVFYHGGGFIVGDIDSHDEVARVLTAQVGAVTVSVNYRLAPEHPFPAAPDDCFAALKWAAANAAALGADPSRIIVAGDSAGGNLAAVAAQRARDEGGPALKGQVLVYPVTELGAEKPPGPDGKYYIITPKDTAYYDKCYTPDPEMKKHPHGSPLLAKSLQNLPPAIVITAEYDPLR